MSPAPTEWLQLGFIGYFIALNAGYLGLNLLSMASLQRYMRGHPGPGESPAYLGIEPAVSLLVPAYNEEATIRTSVRSMLQLQYPEFELVVVNDGSKDGTLQALVEEFQLVPHPQPLQLALPHA